MNTLGKQSLFWDVDLGSLDASAHEDFIVRRILSMGDIADLAWARKTYDADSMKEIFLRSADRLDSKSRNFWKFHFDISDDTVCIPKPSTDGRGAFSKR